MRYLPLTDADRLPWLGRIAATIDEWRDAGISGVVTCSALKRAYRDVIVGDGKEVRLVHLAGTRALINTSPEPFSNWAASFGEDIGVAGILWLAAFQQARAIDADLDRAAKGAVWGAFQNSGQTCMSGACACATGQTLCGRACVNTATDAANCGTCGSTCAPRANTTVTCATGTCAYACATGFGDCDGDVANGCEIDLRTSTASCAPASCASWLARTLGSSETDLMSQRAQRLRSLLHHRLDASACHGLRR